MQLNLLYLVQNTRFKVKQMIMMNVTNMVKGALNGGADLVFLLASVLFASCSAAQGVQPRNVCIS